LEQKSGCIVANVCIHNRQFISEFVPKDMPVFFLNKHGDHREYKFEQLLPFAFDHDTSKEYLQK